MSQQQPQQQPQLPKMSSTPEYRSVTMAPSMPPPLRSPFFLPQESNKQQVSTAVTPTRSVPPTKLANNNNNNSKPWTLVHPLPSVPAGYMLERNQIHIPTTTSPAQEIANRISECLSLRSFVITETSSEIKNAFRAESCKGVLFRINFFSSSSSQDSEGEKTIIIEFQRLAGCSYEFQRTFQAVHRCVHQLEDLTQQELEFPTCAVPPTGNRKERLLDTFSIAMDMIQSSSSRLDSQLMGLEVLEPMSTSPDIVPLLLSSTHLTTLLNFCRGTEEPLSQLQQQQECLLKRRALSILANALGEDSARPNNNNKNYDHQEVMILNTLLSCLRNNNNRLCHDPHQSFQVARCLVSLSKTNASFLKDSQAVSLLLAPRRGGHQHHLALEQEYQKLESILLLSS